MAKDQKKRKVLSAKARVVLWICDEHPDLEGRDLIEEVARGCLELLEDVKSLSTRLDEVENELSYRSTQAQEDQRTIRALRKRMAVLSQLLTEEVSDRADLS